jgi:hypothetical protein
MLGQIPKVTEIKHKLAHNQLLTEYELTYLIGWLDFSCELVREVHKENHKD